MKSQGPEAWDWGRPSPEAVYRDNPRFPQWSALGTVSEVGRRRLQETDRRAERSSLQQDYPANPESARPAAERRLRETLQFPPGGLSPFAPEAVGEVIDRLRQKGAFETGWQTLAPLADGEVTPDPEEPLPIPIGLADVVKVNLKSYRTLHQQSGSPEARESIQATIRRACLDLIHESGHHRTIERILAMFEIDPRQLTDDLFQTLPAQTDQPIRSAQPTYRGHADAADAVLPPSPSAAAAGANRGRARARSRWVCGGLPAHAV